MKHIVSVLSGILAVSLLASAAWTADEVPSVTAPGTQKMADEMEKAYPGLASGMLAHARLADLPEGILLRSGDVTITVEEFAKPIEDAPPRVREQLKKNALFLLEHLATSKVLLTVAREAASKTNTEAPRLSDNEVVRAWFQEALAEIEVADAEIRAFYD